MYRKSKKPYLDWTLARIYLLPDGRTLTAVPQIDSRGIRGSFNKRRTSSGKPIWYVFIDESGVPFHRKGENRFVMGGVVTDDPERLAQTILAYNSETVDEQTGQIKEPSEWSAPGRSEVKHSTTHHAIHEGIMDDMARCGVSGYSVVVTKRLSEEEGQDPKDLYMETFGDLLRLIKDEGPDGLYRIRIDESDWFDRGEFEKKAAAILKGPKKKLAKRNGVMSADSDLVPGIQAADIMVGEQRRVLGRQSESSFMRQHHMKKRQKTKLTREYGKRCGCRLRPDEGGRC